MDNTKNKDIEMRYNKLKKVRNMITEASKKVQEYESNPMIQDYVYQKKLLDLYSKYELDNVDDMQLLEKVLNDEDLGIDYSNIYVYYGTYAVSPVDGSFQLINYNNPNAKCRKYRDIKSGDIKQITLSKEPKFLEDNIVLFAEDKIDEDFEKFYNDSRKHYFELTDEFGLYVAKTQMTLSKRHYKPQVNNK